MGIASRAAAPPARPPRVGRQDADRPSGPASAVLPWSGRSVRLGPGLTRKSTDVQFLDGPSGRRASLLGRGLDVWEVIATIRDNNGSMAEAAEYLQIPDGLVEAP